MSVSLKNVSIISNVTITSSSTSAVTPVADFTASPTSGNAPLAVNFTDTSTNTPTSWSWNFGDGTNSALQNPTPIYTDSGTYTVSLTATNSAGSNTKTVTDYITVNPPAFTGVGTVSTIPNGQWFSAAYVNGNYVAAAQGSGNRTTFVTSNGTTGTSYGTALPDCGIGLNSYWTGLSSNGSLMMAVSNNGYVAATTDGITWNGGLLSTGALYRGSGYGNGKWVIMGQGTIGAYSTDNGANWTTMTLPLSAVYNNPVYVNGGWISPSQSSAFNITSSDGVNWTQHSAPAAMQSIAYGNGVYVGISPSSGTTYTSTNGTTWTTHTAALPDGGPWSNIRYGNGYFVTVSGNVSGVSYSADGANWTTVAGSTSVSNFRSLAYGNGKFVVFPHGIKMMLVQ